MEQNGNSTKRSRSEVERDNLPNVEYIHFKNKAVLIYRR